MQSVSRSKYPYIQCPAQPKHTPNVGHCSPPSFFAHLMGIGPHAHTLLTLQLLHLDHSGRVVSFVRWRPAVLISPQIGHSLSKKCGRTPSAELVCPETLLKQIQVGVEVKERLLGR